MDELLKQAIKGLGISVPILAWRMVGDRLELHLYGGQVLSWPPQPAALPLAGPKRSPRPKSTISNQKSSIKR